jgi:DNA polymerase sigma
MEAICSKSDSARLSAQHLYDPVTHRQTPVAVDSERTKDTIAIFQKAFELYNERRYSIAESH